MKSIIRRIQQMELYLDTLQAAYLSDPLSIHRDAGLQSMLRALREYYEGGQWLSDYEADERQLLPKDLKRGVLSEDGVYNLLCGIDRLRQ